MFIYRFKLFSYQILAPKEMKDCKEPKKATEICLDTIKLDPESYQFGHTKAR